MPSTAPTRTVQVPVPVPVVAMHNGQHLHHNNHYLQQQQHHHRQFQHQQQLLQYQQHPTTTSSCLFVASYSITSHITNSYMALQNVHDCHLTIPVTVAAPIASSPVPPTTQLQKMTIEGGGGGGGGDVKGRSPHPAAAAGAANGNGNSNAAATTTTTTAYYTATKVGSLHVIDPVTHQHVYLRRVLYVPDFDFSYPIQQLHELQQQRRNHGLEEAPPIAAGAPPPPTAVIVVLFSVPKSVEDGCLVVDGRQQHEEEMQRLQKRGKMKKTIVGMFGRKTSSKSTSTSSSTSNRNISNPTSSSPSSVDWFEIRRDKFALRFMQNVPAKTNAVSNPEQKDNEDRNNKTNEGEIIYMNVMRFLNPVILSPPMTTHHDHEHRHRHHPYHDAGHLPQLAGSLTTSVVGSDIHSQAGCSVSVKSNHSGTSQHLDVNDSSSIVSKSSRTSKKSKSSKRSSKKPGHRRTNSNSSAGNGSHYSGIGSFGGGFGVGGFSNGSASGATRGAGAGGGFSNGSASGATRGHRRTNSKSQELRF
eukprot:CAMPEP_0113455114 /NCGR_PEP_ID=MMETSP0014_2-20120614/8209_1 /TAXON_ID=2857 /ORGANISM="Nitzschia sp." /LENGTH=528 /DNA_ID=CAMNT_0000346535 /DNA_START=448 /DNA_END=2034 /DNA_ORIENTATION=- /assembly_acc=CAM_ASM_000159